MHLSQHRRLERLENREYYYRLDKGRLHGFIWKCPRRTPTSLSPLYSPSHREYVTILILCAFLDNTGAKNFSLQRMPTCYFGKSPETIALRRPSTFKINAMNLRITSASHWSGSWRDWKLFVEYVYATCRQSESPSETRPVTRSNGHLLICQRSWKATTQIQSFALMLVLHLNLLISCSPLQAEKLNLFSRFYLLRVAN